MPQEKVMGLSIICLFSQKMLIADFSQEREKILGKSPMYVYLTKRRHLPQSKSLWISNIRNQELMTKHLTCVELFSGAGGLAVGLHEAGFRHKLLLEKSKEAFLTLTTNQANGFKSYKDTEIANVDVRDFDFRSLKDSIDLVAGGPPCQPFSGAGKSLGCDDPRDMFPHAIRAIAQLSPKAFLLENVRGITRSRFHNYLEYIKLRLEFPHFQIAEKLDWSRNYLRLQKHKTSSSSASDLSYKVFSHLVNSADYGVPQRRHRLFIIGFRNDINVNWCLPKVSHSEHALHHSQHTTGEYWCKLEVANKEKWISQLKEKGSLIETCIIG